MSSAIAAACASRAGVLGETEALQAIVGEDRGGNAPGAPAFQRPPLRVDQRAIVLDQPLERLLGQVEAVEIGVAALEFGHQAQAVAVVVETAMRSHAGVERVLAGVAERRVAEVVAERHRLGKLVVEP
jgi:hypothetical protein